MKVRGCHQAMAIVMVAMATFLVLDPLGLSIISNDKGFVAKAVEQPPWRLWRSIPRDSLNRLSRSRKWAVTPPAYSGDGQPGLGPESLAFDPRGNAIYTGVADGRIFRWDGHHWLPFAFTSPNRSTNLCENGLALPNIIKREHICGRPLGLRFDVNSDKLYIADAYMGILVAEQGGGQAKQLITHVEDKPLKFTNDLDIANDGTIYFTDSSIKYERRNFFMVVLSGDDTGRLLKYDPKTKITSIVLRGLQFPNGLAISKDQNFIVIAESVPGRLLRHWIKGPKIGSTEVMTILPGFPDNVRINAQGDFWVAMHSRRSTMNHFFGMHPRLRHAFLQLPIPFKYVYRFFNGGTPHGIIAKVSQSNGNIVDVLEDATGEVVKYASEVEEHDHQLFIGSVLLPYINVYNMS